MDAIRLFVGYDPDEALASSVFIHSAERRSSLPISATKLISRQLAPWFARPREAQQSTEFKYTRFLVPWLCGYEGWALYADGDMICRADMAELWAMRDGRRVVQCVQREHHALTGSGRKFLGREQVGYDRKNWSSLMLFNCSQCRQLTPQYVAQAERLELHQFRWLSFPEDLGALPGEWNHLVGVDGPNPDAKLVHFTLGMPFFHGWRECEYAAEWRAERDAMMAYCGGPELEACA